jgi:hypothetical protein
LFDDLLPFRQHWPPGSPDLDPKEIFTDPQDLGRGVARIDLLACSGIRGWIPAGLRLHPQQSLRAQATPHQQQGQVGSR